ncbi:uncharacterized protein LOC144756289 isoform X2 [Lissotriton helveticus]
MWTSTTTNGATGNGSDDAASSMQPSNTTNNSATDSSFDGTSTPSGHVTEGKVCIELHFLIAGAVGIGLVSAVIAFHVSCFFKRGCKGKKKKQGHEEDQVSTQYASLQNLSIKKGNASRGPELDAEKKSCYATIADIMSEPRPTEEKDTDGTSLTENP